MNAQETNILHCQFSNWYSIFEQHTIKSRFVNLSSEFIDYLKQDGIIMPSSISLNAFGKDELSDDEDLRSVEDNEENINSCYNFDVIENSIKSILSDYNNEVFIKLNWSSPSDASWIAGGSLKCRRLADIYLLLKSKYDKSKIKGRR